MKGRGQPKRKKPQRFHHTFEFPAISANQLWIVRGKHRCPSGAYNKFKRKFFDALKEAGYKKGCLNLSGNLKIHMEVHFSNKRSDLDNSIKAVLDSLVSFFGKWDDSQVAEIEMKKYLCHKGDEKFNVLITKVRRNIDQRERRRKK